MERTAEIERLIAPTVEGLGYELVRVQLSGSGKGQRLQIMAERKDRAEMTVEDCAQISRNVSALLDVEDPVSGQYTLEVSSPGIDRPLVRKSDFARFAGHEARVESRIPIDGRKRFRGTLLGLDGERVRITCDGGVAEISYADIVRAKLVLTDALIGAAKGRENG